MGKIYSGVQGIRKPAMGDWKTYEQRAEAYVDKIKKYAKENSKCPEAGKEISVGVADGKARYVILSLNPVQLIHLDVYDGYRLTAGDVRDELKRHEALEKLFSRKVTK